LLPHLAQFLPTRIDRYREPFVGGGAVFFYLIGGGRLTGPAGLSDVNEELVNAYRVVKSEVELLIGELQKHKSLHTKEHYYAVRAQPYIEGIDGAARTIYLNKTGYNGLYRVNRSGHFNVPFGMYKNPSIFDPESLRRASTALQNAVIEVKCFRTAIDEAVGGDFLYLDPPYIPLSATANFTSYLPGGFGFQDQEDLSECLRNANKRGVEFVLSNSYTDEVCRLYREFQIHRVSATRRINCDGSKRGIVDEAIVCSFELSGNLSEREMEEAV